MALTVRVDISGDAGLLESEDALIPAVIRQLQIGLEQILLPRLRRLIPARTGRLRASFFFRRQPGGGYFAYARRGFYWRFQPGLSESMQAAIREALPALVNWAFERAKLELAL